MKTSDGLLSPIDFEHLQRQFSGKQPAVKGAGAEEYFRSSIEQFNKMAVGPFCWFIADAVKRVSHAAGGMLTEMTGIKPANFINKSPDVLFKKTHPDDIEKMFSFTQKWLEMTIDLSTERRQCIRPTIYIRYLKKAGILKWFMIQFIDELVDNQGRVAFGLTLITDISHAKKDGEAMMSILDTVNMTCHQYFCHNGKTVEVPVLNQPRITKREMDVWIMLAGGLSSKQIAARLVLSVKTVDNHRQRLLHKTGVKSSGELVAYGITKGYI